MLFLLCKALLDHWELALYKYCILLYIIIIITANTIKFINENNDNSNNNNDDDNRSKLITFTELFTAQEVCADSCC